MRNPDRINEFCNELAKLWKNNFPDWRFSQLICNLFGDIGYDPWYIEDDDLMKRFENIIKEKYNGN